VIFFPPAFVAAAAEVEDWQEADLDSFRVLFQELSALGARALRVREDEDGVSYLIVTGQSSAPRVVRFDQSGKPTLEALRRLVLELHASVGASPGWER
jgi:hypothetical protein